MQKVDCECAELWRQQELLKNEFVKKCFKDTQTHMAMMNETKQVQQTKTRPCV